MKFCIYRIIFEQNIEELDLKYNNISYHEQERISEMNIVSYFDYIKDDKYYFYLITYPGEIKKYIEILENNLVRYKFDEISNDVLTNRLDFNKLVLKLDYSKVKFNFFMQDLEKWISDNIDMDIILDRILEVGIDGLTTVEKNFLKNYKQ
jgi:hypothetical protein